MTTMLQTNESPSTVVDERVDHVLAEVYELLRDFARQRREKSENPREVREIDNIT